MSKDSHISYRDSKLTQCLQPCLGGSPKVLMMRYPHFGPCETCFPPGARSISFTFDRVFDHNVTLNEILLAAGGANVATLQASSNSPFCIKTVTDLEEKYRISLDDLDVELA
ncbi:unnamed protein product [Cyprideis torosa]|uniref:Kinesin motor domain-containing protein n=1 Tax=Cyprideis torosa TaxID=163714 RepID=A0A7R8WVU9_9CRUS|nr:unnamed protein product [Cyprideis torosa]CAG0906867.1 unnamed protein product [Cyprideis torosa]